MPAGKAYTVGAAACTSVCVACDYDRAWQRRMQPSTSSHAAYEPELDVLARLEVARGAYLAGLPAAACSCGAHRSVVAAFFGCGQKERPVRGSNP
tara:strand:- start:878 stop:1162 length:285 start_codon:yes stop_codon:yes gene_type:complete